jgi:hypothetical protein
LPSINIRKRSRGRWTRGGTFARHPGRQAVAPIDAKPGTFGACHHLGPLIIAARLYCKVAASFGSLPEEAK